MDTLADNLQSETDKIDDAVQDASGVQGVLSAVSVVTGTLATMGSQLTSTFRGCRASTRRASSRSAFETPTSPEPHGGS